MLSVAIYYIIFNVIMLSVVMRNVIMLSVVAPANLLKNKKIVMDDWTYVFLHTPRSDWVDLNPQYQLSVLPLC